MRFDMRRRLAEIARVSEQHSIPEHVAIGTAAAATVGYVAGIPEFVLLGVIDVGAVTFAICKSITRYGEIELSVAKPFVTIPAPIAQARNGFKFLRHYFGSESDLIKQGVMLLALRKNPLSICVICDGSSPDRIVGVVQLWRVKLSKLKAVCTRKTTLKTLAADDFLELSDEATSDERRSVFFSIALQETYSKEVARMNLRAGIAGTLELLRRAYFTGPMAAQTLHLYAIEGDDGRIALLDKLWFVADDSFCSHDASLPRTFRLDLTEQALGELQHEWQDYDYRSVAV